MTVAESEIDEQYIGICGQKLAFYLDASVLNHLFSIFKEVASTFQYKVLH
jgi:hypothetical protein